MPLGFERLNERQQRPNALINFIKPLEGPDKATSAEFLSRIAAQCYPVMKKHCISVMALQEHEPNPEFLGRNFNAGEVIELVLKDKQGRWLSMKFVQMVMMHELAHCKQMNHSRFFWNVRNEYAQQMEELWRQKYMGEGMWGRGRGLENGAFVTAAPPDNSQIPEQLCGGSYRRRGRKRKRGQQGGEQEKLSYAERQQRRIARKFGKHGDGASLGEDDLLRGALETMAGGKRSQGKPRVANSKRGRELRAAAALARFGQSKNTTPPEQTLDAEELDSETESEWEDDQSAADDRDAVVIRDGRGHDLIKVCGDGEDDEEGAGRELEELRMLSTAPKVKSVGRDKRKRSVRGQEGPHDSVTESETEDANPPPTIKPQRRPHITISSKPALPTVSQIDVETEDEETLALQEKDVDSLAPPASQVDQLRDTDTSNAAPQRIEQKRADLPETPVHASAPSAMDSLACPICSLENEPIAPTCIACLNVLRPNLMPNHWRCASETCKESKYINVGDAGRCGVCGAQKPKISLGTASAEDSRSRLVGLTGSEVLRWD